MPFIEEFINDFIGIIKSGLPGEKAQKIMSPTSRESWLKKLPDKSDATNSAVLILLFPNNNKLYSVLISRTTYDGPHSGEVSLPGGREENVDKNIKQTAIREAEEEIGVIKNDIEVISGLTKLYIPVSNTFVHPFIGYLNYFPDFNRQESEVKEIFIYDINDLRDESKVCNKTMNINGFDIEVPYFNINDFHVWGATAMILSEFKKLLDKFCLK